MKPKHSSKIRPDPNLADSLGIATRCQISTPKKAILGCNFDRCRKKSSKDVNWELITVYLQE